MWKKPQGIGEIADLAWMVLFPLVYFGMSLSMFAWGAYTLGTATYDVLTMTGTTKATVIALEHVRPRAVVYTYTVNGQQYESRCFAPGWYCNSKNVKGGPPLEQYRVGQRVTTHYDPDEPSRSCLIYAWPTGLVGTSLMWVGMTIGGFASISFRFLLPFAMAMLLWGLFLGFWTILGHSFIPPVDILWYLWGFIVLHILLTFLQSRYALLYQREAAPAAAPSESPPSDSP